jgi:hypothetical protein
MAEGSAHSFGYVSAMLTRSRVGYFQPESVGRIAGFVAPERSPTPSRVVGAASMLRVWLDQFVEPR